MSAYVPMWGIAFLMLSIMFKSLKDFYLSGKNGIKRYFKTTPTYFIVTYSFYLLIRIACLVAFFCALHFLEKGGTILIR
ncbi:hypothetical protein Barb6_00163 [Bacteroidales bacterium Barb6]|nr:hypothetical protein Barb6_00163 [Bacteroidales bacterium Barb6]